MTIDYASALGIGAPSGKTGQVVVRSVAIDGAGDTVVVGHISGTVNFNPDPQGTPKVVTAAQDLFVAKYGPTGALLWVDAIGPTNGGGGSQDVYDVALDSAGNVYSTGEFTGPFNFNPDPAGASRLLTAANGADAFVWKLGPSGNLIWATQTVGSAASADIGYGIAVDAAANPFITGTIGLHPGDTAAFKNGTNVVATLTTAVTTENFVARLDGNGNWVWAGAFHGSPGSGSTPNGGTNFTIPGGIALDSADDVYTTGEFIGVTDFDPAGIKPAGLKTAGGPGDSFVSKLDANGNFVWVDAMGGSGLDFGSKIAVDVQRGVVHSLGVFTGTANLNPNKGQPAKTVTAPGGATARDIYVSTLDLNGNYVLGRDLGLSSVLSTLGLGNLALDPTGGLDIIAGYTGSAHVGAYNFTSTAGQGAALFVRLSSTGQFGEATSLPVAAEGGDSNLGVAVNTSGRIALAGTYVASSRAGNPAPVFGTHGVPAVASGNQGLFVASLIRHITTADYDGTGKTNLGVYDPTSGNPAGGVGSFYYNSTLTGQLEAAVFGLTKDHVIPVSGDYDGTGKSNVGVYDVTTGYFYLRANVPGFPNGIESYRWGPLGDDNIPLSGDYDGVGKTNIGVYDRTTGYFYIKPNVPGFPNNVEIYQWGQVGDNVLPLSGDYDGTGKTNIGVYDPISGVPNGTVGSFYIRSTVDGHLEATAFGLAQDHVLPLSGDYDGTGRTNIGVYDPSSGNPAAGVGSFYIWPTIAGVPNNLEAYSFGLTKDRVIPLSGDFEGTGKTNVGVYDPAFGSNPAHSYFFYNSTVNGAVQVQNYGAPQDHPIALATTLSSTPVGNGTPLPSAIRAASQPQPAVLAQVLIPGDGADATPQRPRSRSGTSA